MNEYCYKCGGVHPPMGIAGCPGQSLVEAFPDPRDAAIAALREEIGKVNDALGVIDHCQIAPLFAALREENARLREALEKAARDFLSANGTRPKWWTDNLDLYQGKTALASARPAPAQEQVGDKSTEAALREALDDCVAAYYLPGDHCEMEQAIERARALLARKPAEGIPIVFDHDRAEAAFGRPLAPIYAKPAEEREPEVGE